MWVSRKDLKSRLRAAQNARRNRLEIVKALSQGQISRRDLLKWGLFTSAGFLAHKGGLSPFASAFANHSGSTSIPTGFAPSVLPGNVTPFSQAMPRFDVLPRIASPLTAFTPTPTAAANETQQLLDPALVAAYPGGNMGPVEGRPPGPIWAHQKWNDFLPQVGIEVTQEGAKANTAYRPEVAPDFNSDINPANPIQPRFHPNLNNQALNTVWTFNGTFPPKLVMARYAEPLLFRHHNRLPANPAHNNGFGRHTISTHEHNGHHGAENDGFTGAFFFPNQFYDYHWPWVLAGHFSFNQQATEPKASTPNGSGGTTLIPGDYRETMSTHWFHDHMFGFTSQNVYKGNAGMLNIYSGLDRGNEAIGGVNLKLPSGTAKDWGNLEYDVNLMLADKAWDGDHQLVFDIFDTDGFLGDIITVNGVYKPYFKVERRKYRFRILNGAVARFFKLALSDGKSFYQIGNDGNLLPNRVTLSQTDMLGIAERYDIVIDFTQWSVGQSVFLVNLAEHENGLMPSRSVSITDANNNRSSDPGVGRILEFKIFRQPAQTDNSLVPAQLIPNPVLTSIPVAKERVFEFEDDANQPSPDPETSDDGRWGVGTGVGSRDVGSILAADFGRVSAQPKFGTREIWTLKGGRGWDHPVHIHFEEGQILGRNGGGLSSVPLAERGRKDVYRLGDNGEVKITMQFRDWGGMFMEHCHNTTHEDHAMLLRWEINNGGAPFLVPLPTPIAKPQGVTFRAPNTVLPES